MITTVVRVLLSVVLAAGVLAGCAVAAAEPPGSAAPPSAPEELPAVPEGLVRIPGATPEALPPEVVEQLARPPITVELLAFLDRLRAAAGDDPDFGDPAISPDRRRVVVRWYGDLPPAVQAVVDDPRDAGVEVVVEPTRFRPGDLRSEAARLVREHPGVVVGAGARPAGDGIDVLVAPAVVAEAGGVEQALAAHGVRSRFPLSAAGGAVVPA